MNNKTMLVKCLNCEETYLSDKLCDGYNCPICSGHIVPRGYLKEIEEGIKEAQHDIKSAKENGLIRKYKANPNNQYIHGVNLAEGKEFYIGVDLSSGQDCTIRINVNSESIDKDKSIEEAIEKLYNPRGPRRSGVIE